MAQIGEATIEVKADITDTLAQIEMLNEKLQRAVDLSNELSRVLSTIYQSYPQIGLNS